MSTIYDIAGTTSDIFMFNNKLTFLQGDDEPESFQGQNGDVFFQSNGNIWTKVDNGWKNISSFAIPQPSTNYGKLLYSNGSEYVETSYTVNDIALKSWVNDWSNDATQSSNLVHTTGDETISGVKSFTKKLTAPTPDVSDNSQNVVTTEYIGKKFVYASTKPSTIDSNTVYFIYGS